MNLPAIRTYIRLVADSGHQSQQANLAPPRSSSMNPVQPQLPSTRATPHLSPSVNVEQRQSPTAGAAQQSKLSATGVEIALRREPQFRPESQLRCRAASRGWDYICSYMPTPLLSPTRLQFGVRVDAMRWVELSRVVPAGAIVPRPQKPAPRS